MALVSKQAFTLAFLDWLTVLGQHEDAHYREVAAQLDGALRPLWPQLPNGAHPPETFCAALEPVLLTRVPKATLLSIWKSNYLWRRIYCGQAHRVNPCSTCEGKWSSPRAAENGCPLCGKTGWLR